MATSSITHNFIITDPDEIERFAKALEESAAEPPMPLEVDAKFLDDPDEIREFLQKVKRANAQRELLANEERAGAKGE